MTHEEFIYSVQKFQTLRETEGFPVGHRKHLWELQLIAITTDSGLWEQSQVRKCEARSFSAIPSPQSHLPICLCQTRAHFRGRCFSVLKLHRLLSKFYCEWNERNRNCGFK